MHIPTRALYLTSGINAGRLRLSNQFAAMDGWQSNADSRFDAFISEKRRVERFESFDQRVERGFAAAVKLHRAEIQNAVKRRLKSTGAKFSAATLREMNESIADRTKWLRDVWAQIDADYRSGDGARQETAAREISAALRGEPSAYMRWVYEQKREKRFEGPAARAVREAEERDAELPEVSDEEVNRYHALRLNMSEVERNVKGLYGVAGVQHWAELQAAKDDEYAAKLDDAAAVYKQLLDQSARLDESRRTEHMRNHIERVHQAQVRFKAAMELEQERERLLEAHEAMEAERQRMTREERIERLREAAELRKEGQTSEEVRAAMRQRQMERDAQRQAEYQMQEQEAVLRRKGELLDTIAQFKHSVEEREGRELLQKQQKQQLARKPYASVAVNAFGFSDDDDAVTERDAEHNSMVASPYHHHHHHSAETITNMSNESTQSAVQRSASLSSGAMQQQQQQQQQQQLQLQQKAELWRAINADTYEDPFRTVHQARLDAARTYDPTLARTFPLNLVLGRKYSRQGAGEFAAGNQMDGQILQKGGDVAKSFQWGMSHSTVHDLDADGTRDYFMDGAFHVRDKTTGDIDWRYEKKRGGPVFRGPKFYRMGERREARDPGERPVDPTPHSPWPREHRWRSS